MYWKQGYDAFHDKLEPWDCPYSGFSAEYIWWMEGWRAAKQGWSDWW